mgnify:CR=1 FL=1
MYINAMICLILREYAQALVDAGKKTQDEMSVYLNGTNPGIDWQDEIFRTGITQNYKVELSVISIMIGFFSPSLTNRVALSIQSRNSFLLILILVS